jgi:hypothetical protein
MTAAPVRHVRRFKGMLGNPLAFEWLRPQGSGYGWHAGNPSRPGGLSPYLVLHGGTEFVPYRPLEEDSGLFFRLASTAPDEAGVLGFANQFGALGLSVTASHWADEVSSPLYATVDQRIPEWALTGRGGMEESLAAWRQEISELNELVSAWELVRARDEKTLRERFQWEGGQAVYYLPPEGTLQPVLDDTFPLLSRDEVPEIMARIPGGDVLRPAMLFVQRFVNFRLREQGAFELLWDYERIYPSLNYMPKNLIGAIYIQFALAIEGDKEYRRCPECGKRFELTPGVNRTSRVTCSNVCRTSAYRHRQQRARQLHAEGKGVKEIAKMVGSTADQVKKWVAKKEG